MWIYKTNIFILLFFILAVIAYHLFGYIGHYGYDDMHYAKLAVDFNKGIFDPDNHFSYRTPIILLTAISYSFLGISDFASAFPSLLITTAIILVVYDLLKKKGAYTLSIGLALTVFSHWLIFYSDKLMPDIYVALSVLMSLYIIHLYKFSSSKKHPFIYSGLLSLTLLFGFMAKGTAVLFMPLLFYMALVDFVFKRNRSFWMYSFVAAVIVFFCYFLMIGLITGNVFKRFEAIVNNSYLNLCSYEKQSLLILLKRISYQFFILLIYQTMATGFIFLIASLIRKGSAEFLKINDSYSFWATSAFILLLSSNFMTISLTSYSPMCLDPRHYLFLIPVVSIPASGIITRFIKEKEYQVQIVALIAFFTVVSLFLEGNSFLFHYFPLLILFVFYLLLKHVKANQSLFVVLFVAVLMLQPLTMVNYAQKVNYRKQKQVFKEYVINRTDSCTVITNDVQKNLGSYFNKFQDNGRIRFVNYLEFKNDTTDSRDKLLFMNWYTRYLSGLSYEDLPYYARHISEKNNLMYQDKELEIEIYEMNEILIPEQSFMKLVHSKNSFEEFVPNWSYDPEAVTTEVKYAGEKSNRVAEFSSTFQLEMDSLNLENVSQISIKCSLYCYFPDKTSAKLVVSVENHDGNYIWHGLEINKFIKAYSNWWPVQHEITISKNDIKQGSRLGIYVWNMEREKAFVDDFEILITGY